VLAVSFPHPVDEGREVNMPIHFTCRKCGTRLIARKGSPGKQVHCPKCKCVNQLVVSEPTNGHDFEDEQPPSAEPLRRLKFKMTPIRHTSPAKADNRTPRYSASQMRSVVLKLLSFGAIALLCYVGMTAVRAYNSYVEDVRKSAPERVLEKQRTERSRARGLPTGWPTFEEINDLRNQNVLSRAEAAQRVAAYFPQKTFPRASGTEGRRVEDVVAPLIEMLRDENIYIRIWGAYVLGKIGPQAAAATEVLIQAMKTDPRSKPGDWPTSQLPMPDLLEADLGDPQTSAISAQNFLRNLAVSALGKIGFEAKAAVPALVQGIKDPVIEKAALDALWRIDREAIPPH
jgi:phage FluMu protein Com